MSLSIGIVGLPNVGKSTLFKALTKKQVDIANYPFCTIEPNVGIVEVPDERLLRLADLSKSQKIVPTFVKFVDIAGLVQGASKGEGLGNKFLSHIREVDAIAHVVRAFENPNIIHVNKSVDPERDIQIIESELILADLETVGRRIEELKNKAKSGDKETLKLLEFTQKLQDWLNQGELAKDFSVEDEKLKEYLSQMHLLTSKPIIYVFNAPENYHVPDDFKNSDYVILDIKAEEDILEMPPEELKELGVRSNLYKLIKKSYNILGLITFFTTGEKETRAWTIKKGTTAKRAGRVIHSDFEEKFICANVIYWEDLIKAGSFARARELGLLRTEGKDYIVKDGDVIEFKI
ncbi:Ribosome-binding ATPase YchF [bacterium HR34]|nr:Ribosome-binding ATPase YchF [bacterium HR34]